jgi:hypothetical protein
MMPRRCVRLRGLLLRPAPIGNDRHVRERLGGHGVGRNGFELTDVSVRSRLAMGDDALTLYVDDPVLGNTVSSVGSLRVSDLYHGEWEAKPLSKADCILSTDE